MAYRIATLILGLLVTAIGVVLVPYPGPGWLIVFAGLAILASEFTWARRILDYLRARYDAWAAWLKRQNWAIRVLVLLGTAVIVLITLWLLNTFGTAASWVGVDAGWLHSPLFASGRVAP